MAQVPAGTKFVGIGANVPTPENRSSQNNAFQDVYTIADIVENAQVYDNSTSGLAATTVQDAIDELAVIPAELIIAASDESTAITAGTAKVTFRMPYAMTLTGIKASLTTAQASGNIFTVDVNEAGVSILSAKITIDNTEKTSVTAATQPVISDTSLANDAEITVDVDQIGDGTATGLKVTLIGTRA